MCLRAWIIVSAQTQDGRENLSNRYEEILNSVQSRNNPSKYNYLTVKTEWITKKNLFKTDFC